MIDAGDGRRLQRVHFAVLRKRREAMTFIKGIVGAAAILIGLSAPSAQAGYVVDLTQQGSNVVASGSGTIDTTDLTDLGTATYGYFANIEGHPADLQIGPTGPLITGFYVGISGPTNIGTGTFAVGGDSGSGDPVALGATGLGELFVPVGYISGSALSDSTTWDNQTFSSLGVTPGTYKWTWGSGANADSFTIKIGAAAIPEPATWAMLLIGFAGLGLVGYRSAGRRRRTARHA
jgi:PEP-CTERM motif